METNAFERFIKDVVANEKVWLLQATDGMFAMLESDDRRSYLAAWDRQEEAQAALSDEWEDYSLVEMDLKEWIHWLNEMQEDGAWIGISPDSEGKVLPVEASALLQLLISEKKDQKTMGDF
jgi:RimJ/RimL family protein N-acetyltransferase